MRSAPASFGRAAFSGILRHVETAVSPIWPGSKSILISGREAEALDASVPRESSECCGRFRRTHHLSPLVAVTQGKAEDGEAAGKGTTAERGRKGVDGRRRPEGRPADRRRSWEGNGVPEPV